MRKRFNPRCDFVLMPMRKARGFIRCATCTLALLSGSLLAAATSIAEQPVQTFVYKRVGSLEIKADVYQPAVGQPPQPVIVYIHGGSLINLGRDGIRQNPLKDLFLADGFVVVSIDYRLAPETKLPGIIEDVEDAFRWVREKGPALFGADAERIGAAGASAGGYLTLMTGFRVHPRPCVLVAEMSYGDPVGPWQANPSRHPPHYETHLSRDEAWRQVSGSPIANGADRKGNGSAFNDFVRRNAEWPKAVSGWDPKTEAERFLPYRPARNVTSSYPPTFFMHGEADTDVPFEQPQRMAAELARHGVEHRLIGIPGGEHGYRGGDQGVLEAGRREAAAFVRKHLTGTSCTPSRK
jgi:acetyl esterase/lipase